jgi:PLP dependent protein
VGTLTAGQLAANLLRVQDGIAEACQSAGRPVSAVKLVAVTKGVSPDMIRLLAACGQVDVGENRPQQLAARREELADLPVNWHLIGHLQRNKIRLVVPGTALIHSVDSLRLAVALDAEALSRGVPVRCLLEVNVSGDVAKHGFAPLDLPGVLGQLDQLKWLEVAGLMAMSGLESDPATARRQFEEVCELADRCNANPVARFRLTELSMGMSGDFREAIAAGSTLVRIGSALFAE